MELLPKPIQGTLKRYWKRRQYQRLDGTITSRKSVKVARFGGSSRRFWRIKAVPKLRWKIASPIKLFKKLKNSYINMMLGWAGRVGCLNTENTFVGKRIPRGQQVPVVYSSQELEGRLVYEIYKSLMATQEFYR